MKPEIDIGRLCPAIARARLILREAREQRFMLVSEAAGNYWGTDFNKRRRVPVNLLSLYQSIISRSLIAKDPRYLLTTGHRPYLPVVNAMQTLINRDVARQRMADTFQRIVIDALYSIGIAKVSLATPCDAVSSAWRQQPGKVMIQRVDLDDFVFDCNAKDWSEVSFIGHRYRCPLDVAKQLYKKHADQLSAASSASYDVNKEGDWRIGMLSRGTYGTLEFEEHVELWEIYLPRHRKVITLADQDVVTSTGRGREESLWEQQWVGPDAGPYRILGFGVVPGSCMPKAPMMDLMDLHLDANNAFRKANALIRNFKEVTTFKKGNDEDAEAIMQMVNCGMVGLDNPEAVKSLVTGGQSANLIMQMAEAYKSLFSFMGGNLELLGGRAPQSRTAHQDAMLNENAAAGIQDMQERTVKFVSECGESMGWFYHADPVSVQKVTQSIGGDPDLTISRTIYPWNHPDPRALTRNFPFEDMDLRVDPYSLQHQTPQQKMAAMNQALMQVIIPLAPLLQQQGLTPDMKAYMEFLAQWSDMPEFRQLMQVGDPPSASDSTATELPHDKTLPQASSREVIRRPQSGDTQGSGDQLRARLAGIDMGGNPMKSGMNGQTNGVLK